MAKKKKTPKDEVRVRGVSPAVVEQLYYIHKNLGISLTAYMKPKLREIVDNAPDHLKRKPLED